MLYEWKPRQSLRNFGDALGKYFVQPGWREDKEHVYFPIGSVICDEVMELVLEYGHTPVFVGCGWRGSALSAELVHRSVFHGVRGPNTRDELHRYDIEVEVVGDPAYGITEFITAGEKTGKTLLIPHYYDVMGMSYQYTQLGAEVIQPTVLADNEASIERMVKEISGAEFVLAGAMHAAIVAHAYGVPFAPFAFSYVDCPPKWYDWADSVNIKDVSFASDIQMGRLWYEQNVAA